MMVCSVSPPLPSARGAYQSHRSPGKAQLKELGVKTVYDLRSDTEIERYDTPCPQIDGVEIVRVPVFKVEDYSPQMMAKCVRSHPSAYPRHSPRSMPLSGGLSYTPVERQKYVTYQSARLAIKPLARPSWSSTRKF